MQVRIGWSKCVSQANNHFSNWILRIACCTTRQFIIANSLTLFNYNTLKWYKVIVMLYTHISIWNDLTPAMHQSLKSNIFSLEYGRVFCCICNIYYIVHWVSPWRNVRPFNHTHEIWYTVLSFMAPTNTTIFFFRWWLALKSIMDFSHCTIMYRIQIVYFSISGKMGAFKSDSLLERERVFCPHGLRTVKVFRFDDFRFHSLLIAVIQSDCNQKTKPFWNSDVQLFIDKLFFGELSNLYFTPQCSHFSLSLYFLLNTNIRWKKLKK